MGSERVTKSGQVRLRGIFFYAENIRAAMIETGGIPVSDAGLNKLLDSAMIAHIRSGGDHTKAISVEAVPDQWFVPKKINLHNFPGSVGIPAGGWLYFAVPKKMIFNA